MELKLKFGLEQLLFGMKETHIVDIYGRPDKIYEDEDLNKILVYNQIKSRLTLYKDEEFRLGYITTLHPELKIFNTNIMNLKKEEVITFFKTHKIFNWETEQIDGVEMFFDENNWLFLHFDFDQLVKIEMGAVFNMKDEFEWKFKC